MERGEPFQFPAAKDTAGMLIFDFTCVDAFDTKRLQQPLHVGIHLAIP